MENLSKELGCPLFNWHDTVKLLELDIVPPKYVLNTIALGPQIVMLAKTIAAKNKMCQMKQSVTQILQQLITLRNLQKKAFPETWLWRKRI